MKKYIKHILIVLALILVLIQFYQPALNTNNRQVLTSYFSRVYKVPEKVQSILAVSCNDCHSNNTRYPWYSHIQPVRIYLDDHITEGKRELNFSEFGNYTKRRQKNKFKAMAEEIKEDEMPLQSYTLIHRDAILSSENKKLLLAWIEKMRDSLARAN